MPAGDETPPEWRVRDDLDAEFPRSLQEPDGLILNVQGEGGVLDLDGRDGVDCVYPTKGRSGDFREPEVFDLSGSREGECLIWEPERKYPLTLRAGPSQ